MALLITLASNDVEASSNTGGILELLRPGSHPAVGFGGDPFLSPLDDQVGWWSQLHPAAEPGARLEVDVCRPMPLGAGAGFESSETGWVINTGAQFPRAWLVGGARLHRPRWEGGWEGSRGGLFLHGSGVGAEFAGRVCTPTGLAWQVTGTAGTQARTGPRSAFGTGLRLQNGSGSALQGSWQRVRRPDELSSTLYDAPIAISANLVDESERVEGRWKTVLGLALEGTVAKTRWFAIESVPSLPAYHLAPAGRIIFDQLGLSWESSPRRVLARLTRCEFDLEADLAWMGERFGGLDYARGSLESQLLAIESKGPYGRSIFEVETARLHARARGEIESWPFTSTLIDLLGQRRVFRMDGAARWSRWHLGHARAFGARWRARGASEWIDLRPVAIVESWRPAFLVFGKSDERLDALSVTRVQLMVLSLGASLSLRIADLDLGLEQVVMARVRKEATAQQATADAPRPSTGSGPEKDVGTRACLTVSRRF